ncbi:MAG: adenylate/guanylate cyclase domain-containing protein [Thermodesulfobacteriota bacterium]
MALGRWDRSPRTAWLGSLLTAVAGGLCLLIFPGLTRLSYDLPFSFQPIDRPDEVAIVSMDEDSGEELGQAAVCEWDRRWHAQLVEKLKAAGARLVVFDLVMSVPQEADAVLAAALATHGAVILGSHLQEVGDQAIATGLAVRPPADQLQAAAAGSGVVEVAQDSDTVVRRLLPLLTVGGHQVPTLAWAAAQEAGGPATAEPVQPWADWWLNYYGPPQTIATIPYVAALDPDAAARLRSKIVLVGAPHALAVPAGRADTFLSPFFGGRPRFDGVEIHATALCNLIRGEWLRRLPPLAEWLICLVLGAALGGALCRTTPLAASGMAAGVMVAGSGVGLLLPGYLHLWYPWLVVTGIQAPVALAWAILAHAVRSHVDSQLLARSLSLYLSPRQVAAIRQHPEMLQPGGIRQQISILASDITNFSGIAEHMDAQHLIRHLNAYYEAAIASIHETDGTVIALAGDAIFAIWNAPQPQTDHQQRALAAALLLRQRVAQFNAQAAGPRLHTRVALHQGEACVGNLGSSTHFNYTAIGESVNLAFRLEGLNKYLGTSLLATWEFLAPLTDLVASRGVGRFRLKGLQDWADVHEIIGPPSEREPCQPWCQSFGAGLRLFQERAFAPAEQAFRQTLALRPDDGPSLFYLAEIEKLHGRNLSPDWDSVIELREK